jgi:sec-independent protein translocase protein TatC
MATKLKPIAHEDRLSLVEHLDELRTRLIICIVAFGICFGVAIWQNDILLDVINRPLENSAFQGGTGRGSSDPFEQTAYLQQQQRKLYLQLELLGRQMQRGEDDPRTRAQIEAFTRQARATANAVPPPSARKPVTLGVGEPFTATVRVAAYAALLLSLPVLLFQAYAFVLPAFSSRERQVALPLMLLVPFLFISGVVFAYYAVLPNAIDFLQNFNDDNYDILLQARDYYRFSILLLMVMGVCFQVPIGLIAVTRVGIVTTAQLRKNRRYAILVIAIAAMLLPGQDPVTMLSIMIPLIVLYEGSILLCALLDKREQRSLAREQDEPEPVEDDEERSDQLVRVSDDD